MCLCACEHIHIQYYIYIYVFCIIYMFSSSVCNLINCFTTMNKEKNQHTSIQTLRKGGYIRYGRNEGIFLIRFYIRFEFLSY